MSKKLRKPLSWLLALCMILSLLPMSVFAELPVGNHTITGKNGIISTTYYRDTMSGKTTINIVVKDAAGEVIDQMTADQTYRLATTMTIALKEAYYGVYELDDITIDQGRIYNWTGNFDDHYETTFTCDPKNGTTPTITVQLREPQNTIYLNDREGNQFGTIAYKEGINEVTIEEYLNYELVGTKTVHMAATVNNFSLNLNDGYYFDTDRMQQIKYESNVPGQTFTYNRGDGTNYNNLVIGVVAVPGLTQNRGTVKLYFFNYEDGVKVDFTRYVNGGVLHLDEACKDQNIRFNYDGEDYHFVYSDWAQEDVVFLPEDTLIYVQPIIKDGYVFDYWKSADGYGDHANSLYTVVNGTLKEETGIEGLDEGVYAFSPEMAFRCGSGYDRLQIGLHMVEGDKTYYTVSYDANGGSGSMDAQTFSEYGCFIQTNQFTKSGSEFVRWNTQPDGNGTDYAAGTFYNEKHNLKLYAIWSDGTIEPEPGDGYTITGFTKELVTNANDVPAELITTDYDYPENGTVKVPVNSTVTLLYKLTVKGDMNAQYTITDENVNVVSGALSGTLTSTSADIYVTKTFKVTDIEDSKLSNTAVIAAGKDTKLGKDVGSDTEDVNAEEAAPVPPTDKELKDLLADEEVSIVCISAEVEHEAQTYGLLDGGYTIGEVQGSVTDGYTCTVTVSPAAYVAKYNEETAVTHELEPTGQGNKEIVVKWENSAWVAADSTAATVKYTVKCTTPAEEGKPNAPDKGYLKRIPVEVTCTNNDATHTPKTKLYTLADGVYESGEVMWDSNEGKYACKITVYSSAYVAKYNTETDSKHELDVAHQEPATFTVYYQDGQWVVSGIEVKFTVKCQQTVPQWVTITFNSGEHGDFGRYHVTSKNVELTKVNSLTATQIPTVYPYNGYKFIGWYKDVDKSKLYSDADLLEMKFSNSATFVAQYKRTGGSGVDVDDDYDVIYNANFTDGGYPRRVGYDEGDKVTVSENKWFEREGYTFIGWNTKANGNGDSYLPGDTFRMPDSDVYLYAQWQKNKPGPDDTGVSRWLETEDHNAYLTGYPDSTFGADRNMTRAEVAQMFYALLKNKNVMITTSFSDVSNDAWYATAVKTMASLGMMSGYPDGTFRPDEPITRAEFATVALAFAYEPKDADCNYYDVPENAWFYTYVAQATTYGWIGGSSGYFRPNDMITRAEVSVIVNNMLGRAADEDYVDKHEDDLVTFPDVKPSYWAYYSIMETVNDHEYTKDNGLEDWK